MNILVTGGAGYIGSHTHHLLCDLGHNVYVIDNLYSGHTWAIHPKAEFVHADIADQPIVSELLNRAKIDSVIHFAAHMEVEESVHFPSKYYNNNPLRTFAFFSNCRSAGVKNFVFSSTAATYGEPENSPISETETQKPINPYGRSKLMSEWMIQDLAKEFSDFNYTILRYFNVAGAHPNGIIGQSTPRATHLIKIASQVASGKRAGMSIFGSDYPTPDGTCVRDYIHVMDLAQIHINALEFLKRGHGSNVFNCGYGRGYSVLEVIDAMNTVAKTKINVEMAARRAGDPPHLVADVQKVKDVLEFKPQYDDLELICSSALKWEQSQ